MLKNKRFYELSGSFDYWVIALEKRFLGAEVGWKIRAVITISLIKYE
jgi:hypothetical protein